MATIRLTEDQAGHLAGLLATWLASEQNPVWREYFGRKWDPVFTALNGSGGISLRTTKHAATREA